MKNRQCKNCSSEDTFDVQTYKRVWHCCRTCGAAHATQKEKYPFSFLPYDDVKSGKVEDAQGMYDYFTTDVHIDWAVREGQEFIRDFINPNSIEIEGKRILDVSGGNGYFVNEFGKLGATVSLTEFNQNAVDFAEEKLSLDEVFVYDMNADDLRQKIVGEYDVILCRANLMFCDDVGKFASTLLSCLSKDGVVVVTNCVAPTLGVFVRVQLDEFSYHLLRQPETIANAFEESGFQTRARFDETDPSLYVYDHDLLPHWMWLHYFYEIRAARIIATERSYGFPARDRRRSHFIFGQAQ